MALGAAYRAELAEELRAQGYEIAADVKSNLRLKEMPRDIERHFSKRRVQIETAMAERGTTSAKAAELAALDTRKEKEATRPDDVARALARGSARASGVTAETLPSCAASAPHEQHAIDTAAVIERVSASHSTFTLADIARAVAEPAQVAGGGLRRIEETMQRIAADERLVKLNEHRYTTRAMLDIERGALDARQAVGPGCELSG